MIYKRLHSPIHTSHGGVLTEWSVVLITLFPELLALLLIWRMERVVDADDDDKCPAEGYQDPVGVQRTSAVSFAFGEGVERSHVVKLVAKREGRGEVL